MRIGLIACLAFILSGCSSTMWRSGAYNALHDYQCMEETGVPRCDPGRMSFREYEELREQATP